MRFFYLLIVLFGLGCDAQSLGPTAPPPPIDTTAVPDKPTKPGVTKAADVPRIDVGYEVPVVSPIQNPQLHRPPLHNPNGVHGRRGPRRS